MHCRPLDFNQAKIQWKKCWRESSYKDIAIRMHKPKIYICLFLIFALLISADMIFALLKKETVKFYSTDAIVGIGVKPLIAGALPLGISRKDVKNIQLNEVNLNFATDSNKSTPLYLNTGSDLFKRIGKFPKLKNKKILFWGTDFNEADLKNWFYATDIKTGNLIWKINLGKEMLQSTGVIDIETGKIYFLTKLFIQRTKKIFGSYWHSFHKIIRSVNLDGSDPQRIIIPMENRLEDKLPYSIGLNCHTALALNKKGPEPYVFFGCATPSFYGYFRGLMGSLEAVFLNENGDFHDPPKLRTFYTSKITSDLRTGYDTGVYQSGMPLELIKNNFILLTTGNGPLFPQSGNYGCSVVRMNGETFKTSILNDSDRGFYSIDDENYTECLYTNADMSSSPTVTLELENNLVSFVLGKDGTLKIFDPYKLPGNEAARKNEISLGKSVFGQPVAFINENDKIQVYAGGTTEINHEMIDVQIGSRSENEFLEKKGYIRDRCIGFSATESVINTRKMNYYYSGKVRNNLVLLDENAEITRKLIDSAAEPLVPALFPGLKKIWAPYVKLMKGPELFSKKYDIPDGYESENIDILLHKRTIFSLPNSILKKMFKNLKYKELSKNVPFIILKKSAQREIHCDKNVNPDFEPLYLYKRFNSELRLNNIQSVYYSFEVDKNRKSKLIFKKWLPKNQVFHRSSMLLTYTSEREPALLFVTSTGKVNSKLHVIDAKTGDILQSLDLKGVTHFSIPILIDGRLYIPTVNKGLRAYELSLKPMAKIFQYSFILGLLKKMIP